MTTATSKTVELPGLIIDFSAVRAVLSADDRPIWAGKIVLTNYDRTDGRIIRLTGNMIDMTVVDFEGDYEEGDPVYAGAERMADSIAFAVMLELGIATYAEAMAA